MSEDHAASPRTDGPVTFRKKPAADAAPAWLLIAWVPLCMYWLARFVMQGDAFGIGLDAFALAVCFILIVVKIIKRRR